MTVVPANNRLICVFPCRVARDLRVVGYAHTFSSCYFSVDRVSIFQANFYADLENTRLRMLQHGSIYRMLAVSQSCCPLDANQWSIVSVYRRLKCEHPCMLRENWVCGCTAFVLTSSFCRLNNSKYYFAVFQIPSPL